MTDFLLLTGASSGIGAQSALQLSRSYNLLLCGRNQENLEQVRASCHKPEQHLILPLDLSEIEKIAVKLSSCIVQNGIRINKFLHSAGIVTLMSARSFDYGFGDEMMKVNVFAAMEIVKTLIRKTPNNKFLNNIIFISALYSKKGVIGNSFYAATKGALDSYMRSIALELAPLVRVNSILPGGVRTPMSEAVYQDELALKEIEKKYPLGLGQLEDIANMAEFLFSERARWITGQQISVDGGAGI